MMIKRFSILFGTEMRHRMDQDREFRSCLGIQEALRCAYAVLAMYIDPAHSSNYVPIDGAPKLTKYFDGYNGEHDRIIACFGRAVRMQALLTQPHPEVVCLRVLFFERGQKQGFAYVEFVFEATNGHTVSTGTRIPGDLF